jgi:hypothetical protein
MQEVGVIGACVAIVREQNDHERLSVQDRLGTVPEPQRRIADGDHAPVGQFQELQGCLGRETAQLVAAEVDDALEAARDQACRQRGRLRQQRRGGPGEPRRDRGLEQPERQRAGEQHRTEARGHREAAVVRGLRHQEHAGVSSARARSARAPSDCR